MNHLKDLIEKKLGFGCMRLPVLGGDDSAIDHERVCGMFDTYLEQGFRYFDTAYGYHGGKSESAVKSCLVDRYDRDKFFLATKMPLWYVKENADYQKIFDTQLERCGVEYFDFYLLHAMNKDSAAKTEELGGFDFIRSKKAEGKIKHIGFSFHDTAEVLDSILTRHPEMEFVQLQINYYDWESESVQSRKCYEVAVKHEVPVIVMEPVKGGTLANMVGEPANILMSLNKEASFASFAIRYAASLPNVMLVLSGMSDEEQLQDNISYMKDFVPMSDEEQDAIRQVEEELEKMPTIPCTKCRYCVEGCPMKIAIPDVFADYNKALQFGVTESTKNSYKTHTTEGGKVEDCIRCGKCEGQCPQHLEVRKLLEKVAETFYIQ